MYNINKQKTQQKQTKTHKKKQQHYTCSYMIIYMSSKVFYNLTNVTEVCDGNKIIVHSPLICRCPRPVSTW
jgi:hypothetical protein